MESGIHLCESNVSLNPLLLYELGTEGKQDIHTVYTVSDAILGTLTDTQAMHPMALSKRDKIYDSWSKYLAFH